jgi:hypothetical protein
MCQHHEKSRIAHTHTHTHIRTNTQTHSVHTRARVCGWVCGWVGGWLCTHTHAHIPSTLMCTDGRCVCAHTHVFCRGVACGAGTWIHFTNAYARTHTCTQHICTGGRKVACINVSTPQASLGFFSTPKIASAHQVPFFCKMRPIVGGNKHTIEAKETYMVENAKNTFYREHRGSMIDENRSAMRTARGILTSFVPLFPLLPPRHPPLPPPHLAPLGDMVLAA